jgi:hypothetical protein
MGRERKQGSRKATKVKEATHGRPWEVCAYRLSAKMTPEIVPAPVKRNWMGDDDEKFVARCLPMNIANQAGWFILNSHAVRLQWNGGRMTSDVAVEYLDGVPEDPVVTSHFGHGVVTWRLPFLFRTPANFDLWVRGPSNYPKADVYPLEGIVETNWSVATFTMNWLLLTSGKPVVFAKGEPICMVFPIRKTDIEQFTAVTEPISSNPELATMHHNWTFDRAGFLMEREAGDWQKDYMRGRVIDRAIGRDHRTRLHVRPFLKK